MSNMSDYYDAHRFKVDYKMFDFEVEKQDDGTEITYASKRLGLLKSDINSGLGQISEDRIRELVKEFKEKSLVDDDATISKLKVAGRETLYNQLAEAYSFGLVCFSGIYNKQSLAAILMEYDLHRHAADLSHKGRYNKWNAITALLYGDWEQAETGCDDVLVYKRDRSAEKYAAVLAMLEQKEVKVADVVSFIMNYSITIKETGKKLKGIIALEKYYRASAPASSNGNPAAPSPKQIASRNKYIARGESPGNDDVFETLKPTQLPDSVEYGRAIFKIVDDNMVIVGYEAWEQQQYEKHIVSRGKRMIAEEKAVLAAAKANAVAADV